MRKILFLVGCCIFMCGCDNHWKNDFQVSDIKLRIVEGLVESKTYLSYSIKNISNYTCNSMKATVEFKSGSLTTEETIYPTIYSSSPLKPNDVIEFESVILNKNYEGYTATFKKLDCYDKDTKK